MKTRNLLSSETRAQLNAGRVAAPDLPDEQHLYTCPSCGQTVDRCRLGEVLHHEETGHQPVADEHPRHRRSFIEPMLPKLSVAPPAGDRWQHEIKYDGYRTQLHLPAEQQKCPLAALAETPSTKESAVALRQLLTSSRCI